MDKNLKTLHVYQKAINNIDDFFEYRYKNKTPEEIRTEVYKHIDWLCNQLKLDKIT